jgi:hypothetical protein
VRVDTADLTLNGPNSGTPGDDSDNRSNEATLRRKVIVNRVSGVTIDGFKIAEGGTSLTSGVSIRSGSNDIDSITVKNNIISGMSDSNSSDFTFGILSFDNPKTNAGTLSNATVRDNKISDIGVDNSTQGVAISLEALTGSNGNTRVDGNSIKNISTLNEGSPGTGIALRPNFGGTDSDAEVTDDNTFENVDIAVSHPEGDNVTESLTNVATVVVNRNGGRQRIFTPTIQNAVDAAERDGANTNDEIEIRGRDDGGAYNERVVLNRDDDNSGRLTLTSPHNITPEIAKSDSGGEPTIAVDRDGVTIEDLKITRTAGGNTVAQAVRVAGNNITLEGNDCEVEGSNNAAVAVLTDSSGAAGNPSFSGPIDSVTIDGGTITASTDNSADGEVGVLVADDGSASFPADNNRPAVTIGSSTSVDFTVAEGNDHVLELDTGGGVINRQAVLTGNGNTFSTQSTSASAASPDSTSQDRDGFSVDELIASTVQDAVDAADSDANIDIKDGTYKERVVIDRASDNSGLTLTSAAGSSKPVIEKNDDNGKPTIAVDHDSITLDDLEVKRDSGSNVAQAVRIAGNDITLDSNNCKIEGSDNAAIAVLTDSSGAAGNPSFTGTIRSVTIDGGTITASTDDNANGEVGVAIANSGNASFSDDSADQPVVTIGSSSPVTFETDKGNDYVVEQGTGGGVVDLQSVLENNAFNSDPNTNASGVSVSDSDRSEFGLSVDGLVASTIQDAVGDAANNADVKIKDGTYNEEVTIGKNITLTKATGTPTISGQVRITRAVGGSNTLKVSDLDINHDSSNAGGNKKSTILFDQTKQKENITIKNNTITGPDGTDGFAVYKRKSSGDPDDGITFRNNIFNAGSSEVNQLVVIEAADGTPNTVDVIGEDNDNQEFNGTVNRGNSPGDDRGVALDHRATSGSIKNNDFRGVSDGTGNNTNFEPIVSATGSNTSIKKNGDDPGANKGLDFEGESAAGNDLQTDLDRNPDDDTVLVKTGDTYTIDQNQQTDEPNRNKIEIPDDTNVTIEGVSDGAELQVPDGGETGVEVNAEDTELKDLTIEGPSDGSDDSTGVNINKKGAIVENLEIKEPSSGSAPDTGVVINSSNECVVNNSTITVNPTAAIEIDGGADNVIEDSTLQTASGASGGAGVLVNSTDGSGNLIALNDIDSEFANGVDIQSGAGADNVTVRFNNLRGSNAGVKNNDSKDVDARSNFWNDKTGPSGDVNDPETGRTADGDGSSIDNGSNDGQVRYDEFLEISNEFILNTGSPPDGRDTDGDNLNEDFNDDSDHFPTDGYLFLRALRQGHFDRLAAIDNPGGDLSKDYTERFDFDGDGADDITRDDVNEMVINRNR